MELLFILAAVLLIEMTAEHEQKLLDYRNCYIYSLPQEVRYHFPASLFGTVCKRLFDIIVSLAVDCLPAHFPDCGTADKTDVFRPDILYTKKIRAVCRTV